MSKVFKNILNNSIFKLLFTFFIYDFSIGVLNLAFNGSSNGFYNWKFEVYIFILFALILGSLFFYIYNVYNLKSFTKEEFKNNLKWFIISVIILSLFFIVKPYMGLEKQPNQDYLNDIISTYPRLVYAYIFVIAPMVEEMFFRGGLLEALSKFEYYLLNKIGRGFDYKSGRLGFISVLICTILFTMAHNPSGASWFAYFVLSAAFMLPRYKTNNILVSIFIHILWNLSTVLLS